MAILETTFRPSDAFRDVRSWVSRLALIEQQVCLIQRANGQPLGTGFLVGPDLVLTGHHVVVPADTGGQPYPDIVARFDFAVSPVTGHLTSGKIFPMAPDNWLIASSPWINTTSLSVNSALLQLASPVGLVDEGNNDQRGWVELADGALEVSPNSSLAIMQHCEGGPMKLAINTQAVIGVDEESGRLMYRTDTSPGSSGAPCFNHDWKFVAMHEGRDFAGRNHNRGVPLKAIREWLIGLGLWNRVSTRSPVAVRTVERQIRTPFAMPPDLRSLIAAGEGPRVEFKRGIVSHGPGGEKRVELQKVVSSVAAFMNSHGGGHVVVGVDDAGQFVGVEHEYALIDPQSANWDGYLRVISSVLTDRLKADSPFTYFKVTRYREHDKDICIIHVEASDTPVFVNDDFYVRIEAQNRPLKGPAMLAFAKKRWPTGAGRP